jgi:hypothetical protein
MSLRLSGGGGVSFTHSLSGVGKRAVGMCRCHA